MRPDFKDLPALAQYVHLIHIRWWQDINTGLLIERNRGELLMLAVSELSEALEGIRKNLMDDHLPHRKMEEVEMADCYIRLLDYAAGFDITLYRFNFTADLNLISDKKGEALACISRAILEVSINISLSMIRTYCAKFNLDLENAFFEKLEYNITRLDHTHEQRRLAEGKKF